MADTEETERIFNVPIRREVVGLPRQKRAPGAVKVLKTFVRRHMKAGESQIWIDPPVNERIWARGIQKPPHTIRIRAVKFEEDDLVEISLPEE